MYPPMTAGISIARPIGHDITKAMITAAAYAPNSSRPYAVPVNSTNRPRVLTTAKVAEEVYMAGAISWPASAQLAYNDALAKGLSPAQAKDFASVQYGESGFNPNARNASGASGLYQLLSPGYVQKANKLGGVFNPEANIQAILPDYVDYYKSHPQLVPGAAGAAVERSGQGAQFYAQGYQHLQGGPSKPLNVGKNLFAAQKTGQAGQTGPSVNTALPTGGGAAPGLPAPLALAFKLLGGDDPSNQVLQFAQQRLALSAAHSKFGPQPSASTQVTPAAPTGGNAFGPGVQGAVTKSTAKAAQAVQATREYLGTPYQWGGESPKGFDCSGLLQYVWGKQGVQIPRTTYDQFKAGTAVAKGHLQPGDAVFFKGSDSKGGLPGHVGMYMGGGKFIEAPHTGSTVRVSNLAERTDYVGARRYA